MRPEGSGVLAGTCAAASITLSLEVSRAFTLDTRGQAHPVHPADGASWCPQQGAEPVELQVWVSAPKILGLPPLEEPPGLMVAWEQPGTQGSVVLLETKGLWGTMRGEGGLLDPHS